MTFLTIKAAVAARFAELSLFPLFRVDADKDSMWQTYLGSFPEGTNPIFRKRTEHDCSCCRSFIRAVGNVVAIDPQTYQIMSIWDVLPDHPTYGPVTTAMAGLIRSAPIREPFLHTERHAGHDRNFEEILGEVHTFNHFHVQVPTQYVKRGIEIGPINSDARAKRDVLLRGLSELTTDAFDTVLELIAQNTLYRGAEHKHNLNQFRGLMPKFHRLTQDQQVNAAWLMAATLPDAVARLRNTAIGQLLIDLSEGVDMEQAVRKYEAMVAPSNYKRPTALVTPRMVADAKQKLIDLGLTSALERRYAVMTDITVNNTLFADRSARKVMGDVFDEIATSAKPKPKTDKVEEISIDKFLADVLPQAQTLELFVENRHAANLVSLTAPVDPTAAPLFKWNNLFAWAYSGDVADSMKERVKKAGGNVTGELCCRLGWFNNDDLDFHLREPGYHIDYTRKRRLSPNGGTLDVDMNGGDGMDPNRTPVENIFYKSLRTMKPGTYSLSVHQFNQRERIDVGFEVEIDILGTIHRFAYDKPVSGYINVVDLVVSRVHDETLIEIKPYLPSTTASKTLWNIQTEQFHRVNIALLSPNYWDEQGVGNKHFFFMLDGCRNDDTARGFFNEFLKSELDQHRKVFEMVGAKMRTDEAPDQLSGLGFSSTQRNSALVRVTGAFTRTLKVNF